MSVLQDLALKIRGEHRAACDASKRAVQHARAAGQLLIAAKQRLSHGEWLPWLREHCDLAPRTAQCYMQLARLTAREAQRVAHLALREALRTVATPTPADKTASDSPFANERIIEAALAYFRATGFPYRRVPVHVAMQAVNRLAATELSALLSSPTAYDVADTYHPHRFSAGGASKTLSPLAAFENDDHLQRVLRFELERGNAIPAGFFTGLSIISGAQTCSNFRPGVACHYYKRFCPTNGVALDTSTGYGGRLVGFMASGRAGRYVGIDPNRLTHDGNLRLAADLGFAESVELHCVPAEDVDLDLVRNRCDFALTSPPYFSKEHYSDDLTQSWVRYPTADAWREGFLRPMLRLQFTALKRGAVSVLNIDDVTIKGTTHPLTEWTQTIAADIGFKLVRVERLALASYWTALSGAETSEPMFIFKKP